MGYKIIANPVAGRGKAKASIERVISILRERKVEFDLTLTHAPGEATELAQNAVKDGWKAIISLGGDGTASEIIGGLAGSDSALGIICCGTGNDFARNLGLPTDIGRALNVILSDKRRRIDVGCERDQIFANIAGIGFSSDVTAQANAMQKVNGSLSFFAATYKALSSLKAKPVRIELDDETIETEIVNITISNMRYAGGGMIFAPDAIVDDGLFDICVIGKISKLSLAMTFPQMYRKTGPKHPALMRFKSSKIRISSDQPLAKMFDGNINGETPLEAKIIPQAIEVIVP